MPHLPKLAIVGRPNVGKSALFNRICKKRIAIVDEAEGVTRDRIYSEADVFGLKFEVVDTGGINSRSKAMFNEEIKRQAEIAIEEADTIIMVVDAQVGITDLDKELSSILLRTKKPLCLAVNKIDNLSQMNLFYEFRSLGIKKQIPVSAAQSWQIAELLEAAFEGFSKENQEEDTEKKINIAIVGRPNVGKSSLINYLLEEERCIVSPIPGTTRDSIDVSFTYNDTLYTLIDTAGIRRKGAEHEVVDKFASIRTDRAIERADICLLMLDAQQGMTTQEKRIANTIEEEGKGCILLFNKWDLVKGFRMEHCLQGIEEEVSFLKHCPKLFISALTGRNVEKIFEVINQVHADSQKRITTHQLNKFVGAALQKNNPPMIMGKRLRIYYMAQVSIQPPTFILFVNFPNLMTETYKKYLYNQFRETYGFTGVPITIHLKGKKKATEDREIVGHAKPRSHPDDKHPIEIKEPIGEELESSDEFSEDEDGNDNFDEDFLSGHPDPDNNSK
jgi:GTPase